MKKQFLLALLTGSFLTFVSCGKDEAKPDNIWTDGEVTFTLVKGSDWTLPANQDKITDNVILTRQNQGPIYNYQWWQDNFQEDATYNDLEADFWDNEGDKVFTNTGGTKGVRWAILDNSGFGDEWSELPADMYGELGDPTNFYSFHNIGSLVRLLANGSEITEVTDNFTVNGDETSTVMPNLVGQRLGVWLVEDDIYLELKFTNWGSGPQGGDGTAGALTYTRTSK